MKSCADALRAPLFDPPAGLIPEGVRPPLLYKAKRGAGHVVLTVMIESIGAPRSTPLDWETVESGFRVVGHRREVTLRPGHVIEVKATSPNGDEVVAVVDEIAATLRVVNRAGRATWPMTRILSIGILLIGLVGFPVKRFILR